MWNQALFIIAFLLGIIIIILSLLTFIIPKAKSHLFIKLLFDLTYIAQMTLIFFYSNSYVVLVGIMSNIVGAIRDVAYMKNESKDARFYWTIALTMLMITLLQFTYSTPVSYLPIVGTLINTVALSLKNKRFVCLLTIFGQIAFISYYLLLIKDSDLLTILNAIAALTLFISAIIGFIYSFKKEKTLLA